MKKVSDIVFEYIASVGIDTVFTVSGGGCMHLIDSLGKNKQLSYVCNHHEQACAMAAEGYSRTSGLPGCILVTTGPGGTNALTGVLCAFQDSIPMIIISGQVPTNQISRNTGCRQIGQQEFNIVDTVKHMTKYATIVTEPSKIIYELEKALYIATSGRPGPVWIDIPLDIQSSLVCTDSANHYEIPIINTNYDQSIHRMYIEILKDELSRSKKPVVVVGGGIKASGTTKLLKQFLRKTGIPVMSGPHSAVDVINNDYKYYSGRFGILGQKTSNQLIQESDLVISLGSRLNPKMIGYDSLAFAPNANKFIVDIDRNELNKLNLSKTTFKCLMDLKIFFSMVSDTITAPRIKEWQEYAIKKRKTETLVLPKHREIKDYVSTYVFSECLQEYLKADSIIVTSDGTAHVVPLKTIQLTGNQQLFSNEGTAPMGYGLPAAIGAYYGSKKPIICVEGDGSIMMNLQELQTIKHHNMPIKIFILNNDGYLSIKLTQESFFKGHLVASNNISGVSIPSYKKIAQSFNYKYFSIKNNNQIHRELKKIFMNDENCIIEIFTDPNEQHEPKVKAKGIDNNGKIIPGELTDI